MTLVLLIPGVGMGAGQAAAGGVALTLKTQQGAGG
jgi:hypothetical protein